MSISSCFRFSAKPTVSKSISEVSSLRTPIHAREMLNKQIKKEKESFQAKHEDCPEGLKDFVPRLYENQNVHQYYNDVFSKLPHTEKVKFQEGCNALDRYDVKGGANILRSITGVNH